MLALKERLPENIIDYAFVLNLLDGNDELGREVIQMMVDDLYTICSRLNNHIEKKNWKEIALVSERLEDAAIYSGMNQIKILAHRINTSAKAEDAIKVYQEIDELEKAVQAILVNARTELAITPSSR